MIDLAIYFAVFSVGVYLENKFKVVQTLIDVYHKVKDTFKKLG